MDCLIPTCGSQVKKPCLDENCHNEPTKEPPQGWRRGSSQSGELCHQPHRSSSWLSSKLSRWKPRETQHGGPTSVNSPEPATCAEWPSASPPQKETWLLDPEQETLYEVSTPKLQVLSPSPAATEVLGACSADIKQPIFIVLWMTLLSTQMRGVLLKKTG